MDFQVLCLKTIMTCYINVSIVRSGKPTLDFIPYILRCCLCNLVLEEAHVLSQLAINITNKQTNKQKGGLDTSRVKVLITDQ